jgi:hypothetical protein
MVAIDDTCEDECVAASYGYGPDDTRIGQVVDDGSTVTTTGYLGRNPPPLAAAANIRGKQISYH